MVLVETLMAVMRKLTLAEEEFVFRKLTFLIAIFCLVRLLNSNCQESCQAKDVACSSINKKLAEHVLLEDLRESCVSVLTKTLTTAPFIIPPTPIFRS